ncbi:MAG TPA: N-6 DNA methylase [Rhizomicrobium sp.]|jgi:adenine-specific DNA-methyltransferase|nr:N-6 DNA methylase [Rhizomicrobium sp.]
MGRRAAVRKAELTGSLCAAESLADIRGAARQWAAAAEESRASSQAALFAWAAMEAYASVAAPRAQLSRPGALSGTLDSAASALARAFGCEAARLDVFSAMHAITSLYPSLLPAGRRSALGAYYTPPVLADRLVTLAEEAGLDWRTARVLDPASGGGTFLLRCAAKMRDALAGIEPALALAQIGNRLFGLEIDPFAAALTQSSLDILLADLAAASGHRVPSLVRVCDALDQPAEAKFDLVITNPPYGRVALTPSQRKEYARSLYGHANLYAVFTDIAIRWANPRGLIAYLTPTSMLGGQYYAALRALIAKAAPPLDLDFVHARGGVFEDVLQETMLALYVKGAKRLRVSVQYLRVQSETKAEITRNGTFGLPLDPSRPWFAPRDPKHAPLISHIEQMPHRLSDWGYEVSTGPLVWNRHKPQLRTARGKTSLPLVWAESVTFDGRFEFRAAKKNHAPWFEIMGTGDEWLIARKTCVLVQRTTAKEQSRRLIAAELPPDIIEKHGGVVIENHLNMIRSKSTPLVSPACLAAVLNSRAADEAFRCISGSVAVSAFELESLPVPAPAAMRAVERLIARHASSERIDAAIGKLYGINP